MFVEANFEVREGDVEERGNEELWREGQSELLSFCHSIILSFTVLPMQLGLAIQVNKESFS